MRPNIRELLRYSLNQEGYAVEEAADGAEALDALPGARPTSVMLDLIAAADVGAGDVPGAALRPGDRALSSSS